MPLYRAHSKKYLMPGLASGIFTNPNIDRTRQPLNTSIAAHTASGKWFTDKFGIDYRSKALFCTGLIHIARGYVNPARALVEILPRGDFSICFSADCLDLYGHLQFRDCLSVENIGKIGAELDELRYIEIKNGGLDEAAASGCEIMIFADEFVYKLAQ